MNKDGIVEIELSIFLFFLSLTVTSFLKINNHLNEITKRERDEFRIQWNKFTPRNIQRVYVEEKQTR